MGAFTATTSELKSDQNEWQTSNSENLFKTKKYSNYETNRYTKIVGNSVFNHKETNIQTFEG